MHSEFLLIRKKKKKKSICFFLIFIFIEKHLNKNDQGQFYNKFKTYRMAYLLFGFSARTLFQHFSYATAVLKITFSFNIKVD